MDISRLQHGLHRSPIAHGRDPAAPSSLTLKPHLDSPTSVSSPGSLTHGHTQTYPRHPAPHGHAHGNSHNHSHSHSHDGDSVDYRELSDERSPINGEEPPKKKQKRNKPTLSCHECVERKTKVRLLEICLSCSSIMPQFEFLFLSSCTLTSPPVWITNLIAFLVSSLLISSPNRGLQLVMRDLSLCQTHAASHNVPPS